MNANIGRKMLGMATRFLKPLMNQRGDTGGNQTDPNAVELDEQGFIPGTQYKSVADLIKGHLDTKTKLDAQGNELGTVRKENEGLKTHAETLANIVKDSQGKKDEPAAKKTGTTDYDKEISAVQEQLANLDNLDKDYSQKQAGLIGKLTKIAAKQASEQTLSVAGELFQQELKKRDASSSQQKFLDENPTFNTPEMQQRIKEVMSKDRTGMHDPMSAYFKILADDLKAQGEQVTTENAELKKRLDLAAGTEKTGKVIVKGQSPGQVTNTKPLTDKELDAGALDVLKKVREAGG